LLEAYEKHLREHENFINQARALVTANGEEDGTGVTGASADSTKDYRNIAKEIEESLKKAPNDSIPTELQEIPMEYDPCNNQGTIFKCASHTSQLISNKILKNAKISLDLSHIFYTPTDLELSQDSEKALVEYEKVRTKKEEIEKELKSLSERDGMDLGTSNEWDAIYGKCFTLELPEYFYFL
jgi:hypothetical protein